MFRCTRSIRRSGAETAGFSTVELLLGVGMMGLAMAATSGFFLASKAHMRNQAIEIETTQAARAVLDMIIRDLRLGGACLPVTGQFISLEGIEAEAEDEIVTRTGLTRPDLSCIRTATRRDAPTTQTFVKVDSIDGFEPGMRAYIRHPNGSGEYFAVANINTERRKLKFAAPLSVDYPTTSGIYGIDERRFFIEPPAGGSDDLPRLMIQIGDGEPTPFATGIEEINLQYELNRNCPPCDVVDLPQNNAEWSVVEQVLVTITARSKVMDVNGEHYRRTLHVGVKPRNLIPR